MIFHQYKAIKFTLPYAQKTFDNKKHCNKLETNTENTHVYDNGSRVIIFVITSRDSQHECGG